MNEQEQFWARDYGAACREKNATFDQESGVEAWRTMLAKAGPIASFLECGSNIGRNIGMLATALPNAPPSAIEVNAEAFDVVRRSYSLEHAFNGTIAGSNLPERAFDLVFTCGVLIHVHPDHLLQTLQRVFDYSRRYVQIGEYFNRTPVMIEYQGQRDRLFKRDFGRYFLQHFPARVVDYGFLWGRVYDGAGFDDITWWLFEK